MVAMKFILVVIAVVAALAAAMAFIAWGIMILTGMTYSYGALAGTLSFENCIPLAIVATLFGFAGGAATRS